MKNIDKVNLYKLQNKIEEHERKIDKWINNKVDIATNEWFRNQCYNTFGQYYLYYKQGDIIIATDKPEGYAIASNQRISPAWTQEKAKYFCVETLKGCSCLPLELL